MINPINPPKIKVLKIGAAKLSDFDQSKVDNSPKNEPIVNHPQAEKPANHSNRKLDQVEREIQRVKYERSRVHLKYRDLLGPKLLPKAPKSDFLAVYEEIEVLSDELRKLFLKKRQIELTGDFKEYKPLDDATQMQIDALKMEKKSISNIKNKTSKNLQKAKVEGNAKNVLKYEQKLAELDLKWLEVESRIEKLTHV